MNNIKSILFGAGSAGLLSGFGALHLFGFGLSLACFLFNVLAALGVSLPFIDVDAIMQFLDSLAL